MELVEFDGIDRMQVENFIIRKIPDHQPVTKAISC